jgi:nitrite reductase (NADH) small subunit
LADGWIGPVQGLDEGRIVLVEADGVEIGVWKVLGQVRAFENRCPHQGGPVCYGQLLGQQEAVLDEHQRVMGERFSSERFNVVCPWHGWSYDALSGENIADARFRLRPCQVEARPEGVFVRRGSAAAR